MLSFALWKEVFSVFSSLYSQRTLGIQWWWESQFVQWQLEQQDYFSLENDDNLLFRLSKMFHNTDVKFWQLLFLFSSLSFSFIFSFTYTFISSRWLLSTWYIVDIFTLMIHVNFMRNSFPLHSAFLHCFFLSLRNILFSSLFFPCWFEISIWLLISS